MNGPSSAHLNSQPGNLLVSGSSPTHLTLRMSSHYGEKQFHPSCEIHVKRMFYLPCLGFFRSKRWWIKWTFPLAANLILLGACFSPLWFPNYYLNQTEVWVTDLAIVWVVHTFILYLQQRWQISNCFEVAELPRWQNGITMFFYIAFMLYFFYYTGIQFYNHFEPDAGKVIMILYMATAWYIYFTTAASLYYFICCKLLQRALSVKEWLLTAGSLELNTFYTQYNEHCKAVRRFAVHWNFVIFLGFLLLTFHIPIDLLSVLVDKNYQDVPGAVVKGLALAWYLYCICSLNNLEGQVVSHLYKARRFSLDDLKVLERYIVYRGLGLDFYGIKINTGAIMKVVILLANLAVPTLYALLKKNVGL